MSTNKKTEEIEKQIDNVKLSIINNIDNITKNCDNLESIEQKTDNLVNESKQFNNRTVKIKKELLIKKIKMWLMIILLILFFLIILITVIILATK